MQTSPIDRREFLSGLASGAALLVLGIPNVSRSQSSPAEIADLSFRPLPLGSVTPTGWLQRQLRLQAEGLTGHLDEFWPDVGRSKWFGGNAEGWERAPYWLDGVIPLAWSLNDVRLKEKCHRYVKMIVDTQRADGWYAPFPKDTGKPYDMWAILLVNKVLVQYHEATLRFPMQAKTSSRYNSAVAIERGPLVYSLKLDEQWTRVNADKPHRELPHGDFEVRPTTPWNYGLLIDEQTPGTDVTFEEQPVGERPFSPDGAGMTATVKGRRLPDWKMAHGWASEVPPDLQVSKEPLETLTLIPYGCTNIRVTEFPRLKK